MKLSPFKEYFYYTRNERNGALVLILLLIFLFTIPSFYPLIFPRKADVDYSAFENMLPVAKPVTDYSDSRSGHKTMPMAAEVTYFDFDPNTATKEELLRMGLMPRVVQTILNYRAKGGRFYKKEDLKKIYGLRQEDYFRLESWIQIRTVAKTKARQWSSTSQNDTLEIAKTKTFEKTASNVVPAWRKAPPTEIDINQASIEEWQQLRGIGPGYSKRITNFRDKLGGFYSIDQVAETYGLPDSTFLSIKHYLKLSPVFRKINVNTATLQELKIHPYISNFQATVLFNYRKQHGNFESMESLKGIKAAFQESDWQRLAPYLNFE